MRTSMVLLGICVAALLIGALRLLTERTPLPTGSSYSAEPDGSMALYAWSEAAGANPERLRETSIDPAQGKTVVIIQPENPLEPTVETAFDTVAQEGGTIVLAGDSVSWLLYARDLGVTVDPIRPTVLSASTPDNALTVPVASGYRVSAATASPLLLAPDGDWLALRMPYKQGSLIVVATPQPFTNAGLSDDQTARFVYRAVVAPAIGGGLAFDEADHSYAPPTDTGPASANELLFGTPVGQAIVYAAGLVFVYLLLCGRRLGPPLTARPPSQTRRTMYEHVQMLASLYRRAGQLAAVRASLSRHYGRELTRGAGGSSKRSEALAEAIGRIDRARTEAELISAVAGVGDAG